MRRQDLERALRSVPEFPQPDAAREQYRTPPGVAAEFMVAVMEEGGITGRRVLDLGCGTGMLSKAANLLGAETVIGVDDDERAIELAEKAVPEARFQVASLEEWTPTSVDTVVMNPPFGAQRKGADRVFYERALEAVRESQGTIWFLQQPINEKFLAAFFHQRGASLERIMQWDYPIEARFEFHAEQVATVEVALYVADARTRR